MASRGKNMGKGYAQERPHDVVAADRAAKDERREERFARQEAKDAEMLAKVDPTDPAWKQLAVDRIKGDFFWFLSNFVKTYDQHSDTERIKRAPVEKEYIRVISDTIFRDKTVIIVKSRQMWLSWFLCSLMFWKTRFFGNSEGYIQ